MLTHDLNDSGSQFTIELQTEATPEGRVGILFTGGEGQLNYKQASMIQGIPGLGGGPRPGQPGYLGEFQDAFGNYFETYAVANPGPREAMASYKNTDVSRFILLPEQRNAGIGTRYRIHQGEGFGIVRIDTKNDRMVLECWPDRNATMRQPYRQLDGWPVELKLSDLSAND